MSAALDQVAEASQRLNDAVLQRYDKDKDGQLNAAEVAAAKEEMQSRGQPRRDGPAGPPPPPAEKKP